MTLTFPRRAAAQVGVCALLLGSFLAPLPPAAATATSPAPATKDSPYAAPRDESGGPVPEPTKPVVLQKMEGSKAPGTEKESPYAAAKDEMALSFGPALGKLWWLLLPIALASASYLYLRRQEESA